MSKTPISGGKGKKPAGKKASPDNQAVPPKKSPTTLRKALTKAKNPETAGTIAQGAPEAITAGASKKVAGKDMPAGVAEAVAAGGSKPGAAKAVAAGDPEAKAQEAAVEAVEAAVAAGGSKENAVDMKEVAVAQATISFEVKFFGGAGEIQFVGEGLDRKETGDATFTAPQDKGRQRVQVGGTAPTGTGGRIEVQVSSGDTVLSAFSDNVFKEFFNSTITYTI